MEKGTSKGLLITGTSHCGKSTLAAQLSSLTGVTALSTDTMARHPGRPWPAPRPHVIDFYRNLTDATRLTLLAHHYQTMRGTITLAIHDNLKPGAFIIEGSAIRAEDAAHYREHGCKTICLVASQKALQNRIHRESDYALQDSDQKSLIDAFIRRSVADQAAHLATARKDNLRCVDTEDPAALRQFTDWAVSYLKGS